MGGGGLLYVLFRNTNEILRFSWHGFKRFPWTGIEWLHCSMMELIFKKGKKEKKEKEKHINKYSIWRRARYVIISTCSYSQGKKYSFSGPLICKGDSIILSSSLPQGGNCNRNVAIELWQATKEVCRCFHCTRVKKKNYFKHKDSNSKVNLRFFLQIKLNAC